MQLTRLQTIHVVSTKTFIQADDKWIPSVCTLLGFDVLYIPTCFTTKFSVANNQPRISLCLFNQLRLCPALWHVNSAAFGRYTLSVFHFLQVHPSGPPEPGERRSPSKNGRGTPFPRAPLNLTTVRKPLCWSSGAVKFKWRSCNQPLMQLSVSSLFIQGGPKNCHTVCMP